MKMKLLYRKATASVLLLLLLLSASGVKGVRADVLYEPYESDFYYEHYDECRTVDETWEINAAGGVRMMKDPESDKVIYTFETVGERMRVYVFYQPEEGGDWAYTDFYTSGKVYSGWIPKALLWKTYRGDDFRADYSSKFTEADNEVGWKGIDRVLFYDYPGSSSYSIWEKDEEFYPDPVHTYLEFTDEQGRKWGYVSYYYMEQGWILLEHPDLGPEEIWPDGVPERDTRNREYYEIVYNEDSTEVRVIEKPIAEEIKGSGNSESPTGNPTESPTETPEPTVSPVPAPGPEKQIPGWVIPVGIAGILAVSAAILLAVVLKKKGGEK